jgi:hypothetical protein
MFFGLRTPSPPRLLIDQCEGIAKTPRREPAAACFSIRSLYMFTITTTPEPAIDGAVIKLTGSFMAEAGQQLQMKLTFALAGHPRNVVLDLTGLEMISSLNIGELVSFRRAILAGPPAEEGAAASGTTPYGLVVIAGASPMIQKTLTFTRLDQLFPLYPDIPSAIAAVQTR